MNLAWVWLVLLIGGAARGDYAAAEGKDGDLQLVVVRGDNTHFAAKLSDAAAVRQAKAVWAWTERLPPKKFDAERLSPKREDILVALGRSPTHSLDIRLRGWSRPEELLSVRVIAAPQEMWGSVPEPLLPSFAVSREGRVSIQVRDRVRIRVVGEDIGTSWEQFGPSARSVEVLLRRAANAELILQSSDRSPVSRAFATAMSVRRGDPSPSLQAQFAGDERGRVRIPSLPRNDIVTLVINAEGVAPQTISGTASELTRQIRLAAAGNIRGRFVDEEGRPLPDVRVEAEAWISSEVAAISANRATSDETGRWAVGNLPRARVVVRATAKRRSTFQREVSLDEGDADIGTVALQPSADVTLEVSDEERNSLAGVAVTTDSGFKGTTGTEGTVSVTGLSPNEAAAVTLSAKSFAKLTVHLRPPLPKRERVMLERAFSVTGSIVTNDGVPVPDAAVTVTTGPSYRRQNADPDGTFSVDFDAGRDFELTFESPSAASVTRKEDAGRPGETRNLGVIELPVGLVVRGRVVDSTGAPLPGARVWVLRPAGAAGPIASWVAGRTAHATSGSEGAFELRGLWSGSMSLRIDAPDFARAYRNVIVGDVPVDTGAIMMVHGSTVAVKAHTDEGLARLDLRGEWLDADMLTAPVVNGTARLSNVPPGSYRVTVLNGRAVVCERQVHVEDGADATVDCPAPTIIRGRVLLDGAPAYGGRLTWSQPAETDSLINTTMSPLGARQERVFGLSRGTIDVAVAADGTFGTGELRAGGWQVSWRSPEGAATPERPISIPDVAEAQIVVEFAGGVLRGRVLDANNQPVAGARVREIQGPLFAMSAPDGSFAMAAVAAGSHRLQAALGAKASPVVDVTVESGKQTPEMILTIDDAQRNVLTVRVLGLSGEPRPNAFVFVEAVGGLRILTADASGMAHGAFPEGLVKGGRLVAFADNSWAFDEIRSGDPNLASENATIRFAETGALRIRSRSLAGSPALFSPRAGDLSWMAARTGSMFSLSPELPLVIHGLPPGLYEITLGSASAMVTVSAGSTANVELP